MTDRTPDADFRAAILADPQNIGAYLGHVALAARRFIDNGESLGFALDLAFGMTKTPASLAPFSAMLESSLERRIVTTLATDNA